jgi:3'-5' exoribonuclease
MRARSSLSPNDARAPTSAVPPLDLPALDLGARVQHTLRVVDRQEKTTTAGEPYIILSLGNASGTIETAPIWANLLAEGWGDGVVRGAAVQAIGQIDRYQGKGPPKRQLKLTAPPRVLPRDSLDLAEFLPRIAEDPARLWEKLDELRRGITSARLRRVLALFFDDEPFRLRFERAPASVGGHHSVVGGLLLHVWEVAYIARAMAKAMRADEGVVLAGVFLHDIGKLEAYDIGWEGFVRTPAGHLLEHVVLGAMMLDDRLTRAAASGTPLVSGEQRLELMHLVLSHHGQLDHGSPVRPLTLEAEIVHRADDASAKSADLSDATAMDEAFREGEQFGDRSKLWRVDRRSIWRRPHVWD